MSCVLNETDICISDSNDITTFSQDITTDEIFLNHYIYVLFKNLLMFA